MTTKKAAKKVAKKAAKKVPAKAAKKAAKKAPAKRAAKKVAEQATITPEQLVMLDGLARRVSINSKVRELDRQSSHTAAEELKLQLDVLDYPPAEVLRCVVAGGGGGPVSSMPAIGNGIGDSDCSDGSGWTVRWIVRMAGYIIDPTLWQVDWIGETSDYLVLSPEVASLMLSTNRRWVEGQSHDVMSYGIEYESVRFRIAYIPTGTNFQP